MIYIERQNKRGGFPTKKPKKASGFYKQRNPNPKHVQIEKALQWAQKSLVQDIEQWECHPHN